MLCPKFNFPFSIFLILGKSNKFRRFNQNDRVKTKDLRARSSNYALEDIILMNTPERSNCFARDKLYFKKLFALIGWTLQTFRVLVSVADQHQ